MPIPAEAGGSREARSAADSTCCNGAFACGVEPVDRRLPPPECPRLPRRALTG